jgi:uncharacterized protein (DUF2252 family)
MLPSDAAARRKNGRTERKAVSRSVHAEWSARPSLRAVEILSATTSDRVADLLPVRWQRMSASPFAYFRGAAAVMADDLLPRRRTGLLAQICGDAHVQNLGAYETAEGQLVFDINDFDETRQGPFEWDLLRFATSLALAGGEAGDSERRAESSIRAFVEEYRRSMRHFAGMPFLDLLRYDIQRRLSSGVVDNVLRKAARMTPQESLSSVARQVRGSLQIVRSETMLAVSDHEARLVLDSLAEYRASLAPDRQVAVDRFHPVDVAFKIAGTGSVGRRNYVVLSVGVAAYDALILQIKQAGESVYQRGSEASAAHCGRRVIEGQRLMQRGSDPLLGWTSIEGRSFIVRQFRDHKASVEPRDLVGKAVVEYARVAGEVFARAHARSGDAIAIAAYCGRSDRLDRAVSEFALRYAAQTRADFAEFLAARKDGRL